MIDLEPIKETLAIWGSIPGDEPARGDMVPARTAVRIADHGLALIAEVERLRTILAAGADLADKWQARSRGFSGPPDDMPDEATYYGVQVASEFGAILRNATVTANG